MTNQNIVLGIVAAVVIVGGAFLLFDGMTSLIVDVKAFSVDENKLTGFQADINSFALDESALLEVDQTLGDVAGPAEMGDAKSVDGTQINQVAGQADLLKI